MSGIISCVIPAHNVLDVAELHFVFASFAHVYALPDSTFPIYTTKQLYQRTPISVPHNRSVHGRRKDCFQGDHLPTLKLKEKHFSTKNIFLLAKYHIARSRGQGPPVPPSDARGSVSKRPHQTQKIGFDLGCFLRLTVTEVFCLLSFVSFAARHQHAQSVSLEWTDRPASRLARVAPAAATNDLQSRQQATSAARTEPVQVRLLPGSTTTVVSQLPLLWMLLFFSLAPSF